LPVPAITVLCIKDLWNIVSHQIPKIKNFLKNSDAYNTINKVMSLIGSWRIPGSPH